MSDSQRACRRFGWTSLLVWALFGLALEGAHGFKLSSYLDDDLTRELLVLAHAHGVGLSLVVIVFGESAVPLLQARAARPALALRIGALSIPIGFALSAIGHPEGDPSLPIVLVPVGALLVLYAIAAAAIAAHRQT